MTNPPDAMGEAVLRAFRCLDKGDQPGARAALNAVIREAQTIRDTLTERTAS